MPPSTHQKPQNHLGTVFAESLTHFELSAWDPSLDGVDVGAAEGDHQGAAGEVAEGDQGGEERDLGCSQHRVNSWIAASS